MSNSTINNLPLKTKEFNKIYHFMIDNDFVFKMNSFEEEVYFFELNGITALIYKSSITGNYHLSLTYNFKSVKIEAENYLGKLDNYMIKHINEFKNIIKNINNNH